MRCLVTGATGFLGSRLARALSETGTTVRVLVRPASDRRRLSGLDIEEAIGDITDRDSVARALDGVDVVYHAAAMYEFGTRDAALMESTNVGGTHTVLDEAVARGLLAVHVSSTAALGPTGPDLEDETHTPATEPRSVYEATKRAAHEYAIELAARGARVRIGAPVTIYGPDDPSMVGLFYRLYAKRLVGIGFLPDIRMSLVHVDDCADGLIRIAGAGEDGEAYILSAQVVTFREWFEALAQASGRRAPKLYVGEKTLMRLRPLAALGAPLVGLSPATAREAIAMTADWAYSGDKARRELGWKPRPLAEGLAQTLAWYRGRERSGARIRVP